MKNIIKTLSLIAIGLGAVQMASAQIDSLTHLNEITVSANKTPIVRGKVAQDVQIINQKDIANANAQTVPDLLAQKGVFVQKSQQGGGSPVLRGFEASRVLLVVDGVRMNNLIYRSGHLQNSLTLNQTMLDRIEVLYGPASAQYGSDALGGVIHAVTLQPVFAKENENDIFKGSGVLRFGSVNNEKTGNVNFLFGGHKWASATSLNVSSFGDLRGGASKNPFYKTNYGERPFYVTRNGLSDSTVTNTNVNNQVNSGYGQADLLQKIAFKPNDFHTHTLNVQLSTSTDINRYDRLTETGGNGAPSYAQWYYGPQNRVLAAYTFDGKDLPGYVKNFHFGVNYQHVQESRHSRRYGSANLSHRNEDVKVIGYDFDISNSVNNHTVAMGLEGQTEWLNSTANRENILTNTTSALDTRYPDGGSFRQTAAAYFTHRWEMNDKLTLTDGARLTYMHLKSVFNDKTFFPLPYNDAIQNNLNICGNIGILYRPSESWRTSLLFSTGFRAPNVDDLSKVFESGDGVLIVPNTKLKPEQTFNLELNISKRFGEFLYWENTVYGTLFRDAIVTDKFQFNGQDSAVYDGVMSRVYAPQNKQKAFIVGFTSTLTARFAKYFNAYGNVTYTYGRVMGDSLTPLDHIPPLMARAGLSFEKQRIQAEFFSQFNAWKHIEDYYLNGEDNEQYATVDGMPAWLTLNFRASIRIVDQMRVQFGVDNILDTQYRTFASGINAPGRNIFVALRSQF